MTLRNPKDVLRNVAEKLAGAENEMSDSLMLEHLPDRPSGWKFSAPTIVVRKSAKKSVGIQQVQGS